MKVTQNFEVQGELNVKRLYFDGVIKIECLKCKEKMKMDFSEDYLSYPTTGEKIELYFYCDKCESEYYLPANLESISIDISYDEDKLIKA